MDFREKWLRTLSEGKNIEPIHLVFVEEPEAHLHAHSNHVVNELDLNCMRYFRRVMDAGDKIPVSNVINLSSTFGANDETEQFVTRYIRLTHCDIFFADAVILVEGPAEKILVPSFLTKADLDSYYISVMDVMHIVSVV